MLSLHRDVERHFVGVVGLADVERVVVAEDDV